MSNHRWTPDEVALLREHYPMQGVAYVAGLLGLAPKKVEQKAYYIGVKNVQAWRGGTAYVRKPAAEPSLVIAAPKRGPAWLPGEVDDLPRSPGFRHVVYPPMPQPTRTNTHSVL